jgi:hypothetical protein
MHGNEADKPMEPLADGKDFTSENGIWSMKITPNLLRLGLLTQVSFWETCAGEN